MKKLSRDIGIAVFVLCGAACANKPNVDSVAIGQDVTLTKADGAVVEGTITSRDEKNVRLTTGRTTKAIPKDQIVDLRVVDKTKPIVLPAAATVREYTIPEGTTLALKLATAIDSEANKVED